MSKKKNGSEGLGFEYQIEDDDDAYEDVDDSDDEYSESDYCYSDYDPDYAPRSTYCGFPRAFLDPNYMPTGLDMNLPFNYKMGVTAEEAEKNGKELVDEEQRVAQKAEKKRLKKKCLAEELLNVNIANSDEEKNISNKKEASMLSAKRPTESSEKHKEINGKESSNEDDGKKEDSPEEESEDELDLTSTFVSKAASIAKRKMELKPKPEKKEKKKKSEKDTEVKQEIQENGNEDNGAIQARSFEQADIGNQLASSGRFEVAVTYFTNAIKFNPKEYKLFGNRSFCYERLMQYDKALNDAEISLSLCPSWTKGYFRKGKALAGLQRYAEAVDALKEVLKLDSTCADAAQELMRVQIIQLMEKGFTREQSTDALIMYGTVHKALEALSNIHESPAIAGNGHAVEEEWIVSGKKGHSAAKSVPRPQIPQTTQLKPVLQPRSAQANIQLGLFGNRSFCYERLMQYDKALNDAEISLSLCPSWTKGYFRKGKALAGLQRYAEAVDALKEVLKLDSTCADAAQELMRVQIIQLMEKGFTREQSTDALIMYGTVHKALEALSNIHESPAIAGNGHAVEEEWIVSGKKGHSAAKSVPRPQIPQTTQLKPVLQPRSAQANIQLGAWKLKEPSYLSVILIILIKIKEGQIYPLLYQDLLLHRLLNP
ncbi:UNVERIFIED_CONTAM: hypothetical protein FKN15_058635 [Acipenser sinensis]